MGDDLVQVGVRVRPHGVKGEVRFLSLSGLPGRFPPGLSLVWRGPAARDLPLTVRSAREKGDTVYAGFHEVPDRTAAEALAGGTLWAPAHTSPSLEPGTYYHHQLIGLRVLDEGGTDLGEVTGVLPGAHDNLEVQLPDGRRFLVPAVEAYLKEVDLPGGRMVIRTPPGLVPDAPRRRGAG